MLARTLSKATAGTGYPLLEFKALDTPLSLLSKSGLLQYLQDVWRTVEIKLALHKEQVYAGRQASDSRSIRLARGQV